jgi:hypothetical protein
MLLHLQAAVEVLVVEVLVAVKARPATVAFLAAESLAKATTEQVVV